IIRRGHKSLEGELLQVDVAETYTPLMREGKVIGAFEIYYDISERIAVLDQVMERSSLLMFAVVAVLLVISSVLLYRAKRSQAERDLARAEWEKTFEAVTDPIMVLTKDFSISRANKAMADWIGVSRRDAVGLTCFQHVHHCNEPIADCPNKRLLQDGKAHSAEVYDDQSGRYFSVSVYPIFDSEENLSGSVHYAKDITASKKAEEELRRAEIKYRIIADNTYAWEFLLGTDSRYIYTSPSCERITGYCPEEFAADPGLFQRIVHPDDQQRIMVHQSAMANRECSCTVDLMFRIIRRDGAVRWMTHDCQSIFAADATFLGVRGSNSDITERKHAADALVQTASSLAEAQRIAQIGSWELDLINNFLTWSDETYRIFDVERHEFSGALESFLELIHPEDRLRVQEEFARSIAERTHYDTVHRILVRDGSFKFIHERCETFYDNSGQPVRSVGTAQDVTYRKLAEEALRESEEKFKGLAASAQDAIIMMDGDGNIAFWNDSAATVFGYDREEVTGMEMHRLLVPERFYSDFSQGFARFQNSGEGVFVGKTLELMAKKRDGAEFPVEFSVSALKVRGKWQAISILRDITDRKRSEVLIQQQLKNMTALSDIGMAISSTLDVRVTLKILLDRLISQLGIDA